MRSSYIFLFFAFIISLSASSQTYTGSGGNIPDNGPPVEFIIDINDLAPSALNGNHGLINVCFDITHTYLADLHIWVISPSGTIVGLVSANGGGDDNYTNTCFDQNALIPIGSGNAPFTGSFIPIDNLGEINNGSDGNGQWTLKVYDNWAQDEGTLNSWSITFDTGAATPITVDSTYLPIVIIDTQGEVIPDEPKINGTMKIIHNPNGDLNYITDAANEYDGPIGIELRGAYSQSLPQKPYSIETRTATNQDSSVSILGMPEEEDWVLIANYNDKSFLRNTLAFKLFSEMGNYATRMHFCEVIVNGSYQGIYLFGEKIKRDNGRVDIAKLDSSENSGDDLTGGYIFKTDYWNWDDSWQSDFHPLDHPELDVRFVQYYPKPGVITPSQEQYLEAYVDSFETALYGISFENPLIGYQNYIDVSSFIDYFLVNELSRNNDGFKKSRYYHKDKNSNNRKIKAGPVWDFDWAWKNIWSCQFANTDGSGWAYLINDCGPDVNSPGWFVRLLQDPWFQNQLRCRYEDFRTSIMDIDSINNYIDSMTLYLDDAQQRHYAKWPILGSDTGAPEVDPPALTYQEEIDRLKNWINLRINWLDENIPGTCNLVDEIVENNSIENLKVFPNPSSDIVRVSFPFGKIEQIKLIDLNGKVIEIQNGNANSAFFNVKDLNPGLYMIQIIDTKGKSYSDKLLVE